MPLFFFDVDSSTGFEIDDLGVELHDLRPMKLEAIKGARGVMAECLLAGRPIEHQRFVIRDDAGTVVFTLSFREILDLSAVNGELIPET